MVRTVFMLGMLSCSGDTDKADTSTRSDSGSDDTGSTADGWSVMADGIGKGVLLSAWSNGDTVLFVGGDMDGGPGVLVRYDGESLCTENNVAERALWWIHGPRAGEWYAVGEAGVVVHSVDGVRTRMDIETEATLFGVWATDDAVIAVGGHAADNIGEIWRHDGTEWTALATGLPGTAFKVSGEWIVGMDILYQIDGSTLTEHPPMGRLLTVRARAEDDVWAVGGFTSSLVVHWDGTEWTEQVSLGVGQPLNGVWTAPGEDVWVAGNFGTTVSWDGAQWNMPEWPVSSEHFHSVWGHGDELLWAGGNLFSGGNNYGTIARYGSGHKSLEATPCD